MMETGTYVNKDGLVTVELEVEKKTGLFYRPGTSDKQMLKEGFAMDYKTVNCTGHRCLDLGGNVGGFILKAAKENAEMVVSYEPEPQNFQVLKKNVEKIRVENPTANIEIVEAAVSDVAGSFPLIVNKTSNSACSASLTAKASAGKNSVMVQVVPISEVLEKYKPTLIKMDVEGAEYDILKEPIPDYVKELAIEFHGFRKADRDRMHGAVNSLKEQGWETVEQTSKIIFGAESLIIGHYRRK